MRRRHNDACVSVAFENPMHLRDRATRFPEVFQEPTTEDSLKIFIRIRNFIGVSQSDVNALPSIVPNNFRSVVHRNDVNYILLCEPAASRSQIENGSLALESCLVPELAIEELQLANSLSAGSKNIFTIWYARYNNDCLVHIVNSPYGTMETT